MKKLLDKLKMTKELVLIVVAIIGFIISAYKMYESHTQQLELLQKTTLRIMIWTPSVPEQDRLEACDSYLKMGYNSETKKKCESILKKVMVDD